MKTNFTLAFIIGYLQSSVLVQMNNWKTTWLLQMSTKWHTKKVS